MNIENKCNERSCFEYGLNSTITEVLLPKETMSMMEHRECSIELGCSYEVIVETSHLKLYKNITYTIPGIGDCENFIVKLYIKFLFCVCIDCIGEICSCQHDYKLPNITINASLKSSSIYIYWNIMPNITISNGINIESILIK